MKIEYKGKQVEATEIKFQVISENWSEYRLEDGTLIRFKPVATKFLRLSDFTESGEPIYRIFSQNIVSASEIPEPLMRKE